MSLPEPQIYTIVRRTWLSRQPSASAALMIAVVQMTLVLGASIYWRDGRDGRDVMAASPALVFNQHQYYRLWTTLFAHADIGHLLANSLLFVTLGFFLNGYFGWKVFPVAALLFGGITNFLALLTYAPDTTLIGASGMVSWMGGAWLILYFAINRQKSMGQRAMRSAGVALLLFAPSETFDPHISYRTHLIGFVLGLVSGYLYFERHKTRLRSAEVVEVVREEDPFNPPLLDGEP